MFTQEQIKSILHVAMINGDMKTYNYFTGMLR